MQGISSVKIYLTDEELQEVKDCFESLKSENLQEKEDGKTSKSNQRTKGRKKSV